MKKNVYISIVILQAFLLTNMVSAMDEAPQKKYTATLKDVAKALIVIEMITLDGKYNHLKIKVSPSAQVLIQALVAAKDVEQQEKQYTEVPFAPFFVDQTPEKVIIKPHVPGTFTVHLPANSPFTMSNPQGTTTIDPELALFNVSKN